MKKGKIFPEHKRCLSLKDKAEGKKKQGEGEYKCGMRNESFGDFLVIFSFFSFLQFDSFL
jgi:hypothetical protein